MTEPPIRQAINLTLDTITRRTRGYRNLVVVLSFVGIAVPLVAILCRQWDWLAGFAVLLPMISGWMFLDARLLRQWSHEVIRICRDGVLDVDVFAGTITTMRHLPQQTIASMIEQLRRHSLPQTINSTSENSSRQRALPDEERAYLSIASLSAVACLAIFASLWTGFLAGQVSGWLAWIISPFAPRWLARIRCSPKLSSQGQNETP